MQAKVFEITYDEPAIGSNNRWSVYVNFHLIGENEKKVHKDLVYTLVCSKEYAENPLEEPADKKTFIMQELDKKLVSELIHDKIEKINALKLASWTDFYKALEEDFYTE